LPSLAAELDAAQRSVLSNLADAAAALDAGGWTGEALQAAIFTAAQDAGLPAGRAFAALYAAFLGQPHGPRAGWLLASLDRDFVIGRLREAATADTLPA
jgi:lysyl-tRNA synthetase class 1